MQEEVKMKVTDVIVGSCLIFAICSYIVDKNTIKELKIQVEQCDYQIQQSMLDSVEKIQAMEKVE
jgi:hypothetical protein